MGGVGGEKGEMGKEGDIEGEEKGGRENKNKKGTKGGIEERNIPFFGLVYYFQNHDHDCVGVALHTYYKRGEEEEEEEEEEERRGRRRERRGRRKRRRRKGRRRERRKPPKASRYSLLECRQKHFCRREGCGRGEEKEEGRKA